MLRLLTQLTNKENTLATYANTDIISNQQHVADTILEKLFPIDPYCIVAGGAPRDWHLGKPASDIDVFFYCGQHTLNTIHDMLVCAGISYEELKLGGTIPEWYKHNPHLKGVYCLVVSGVKVQLMRMDEPTFESVLPQFPLSICHAWYKDGVIHTEKPFLRSIKHKAIYKTNTIYNNEHEYVKKILTKFPEYKYYDAITELAATLLDN